MHQPIDNQLLDRILPGVSRPARYTGGEWNSVVKDWSQVETKIALVFPDLYDLGMSNLGLAILYDVVNRQPDLLAERVFAPWSDMETAMRQARLPLFSLETRRPLAAFDLVGFTLPYQQLYTNLLNLLDLAGIPLRSAERDERWPLVMAGGSSCTNPEPLADFLDLAFVGEGEEAILEIARACAEVRHLPRQQQLRRLARIEGVYVPRLYQVRYHDDGTVAEVTPRSPEARLPVVKRIVTQLPPPPSRLIVPYVDVTHNRATVEIQRGCTRGCRFCHAGMAYRPVRERPMAEILEAVERIVEQTGFEEIGLLSLSSSDYSRIAELVRALTERHRDRHLSISLPSLRIDSFSVELADLLTAGRRSGFTFAPEAATERMRRAINKYIPDEQLLTAADEVFSRGWRRIKLYFMIGHPAETLDDVQAIVDLARQVLRVGRQHHPGKATVSVSVSTFVPQPHTPFQWVALDTAARIQEKQELLRRGLYGRGLTLRWNAPQETFLEAALVRGDRRLGAVIHRAWQLGARFEGWNEHFRWDAWQQAFAECGSEMDFYTHRQRTLDETLPWDHISLGVDRRFLLQDFHLSQAEQSRQDCRNGCYACGILSTFAPLRRETPDEAWACPPVHTPGKEVA
ncbi:MAG: TIGR03960 family B12-binding radical SAM protein [Chloroflexota bacterium]